MMSQVRFFGLNDGDDGMAPNANNGSSETETVANNNQVQLSEQDKKISGQSARGGGQGEEQ